MKRAAMELATLNDEDLFRVVSEGVPSIVNNAVKFNDAARLLFEARKFRMSSVMEGFASEEAAKVLILIDLVRCPRNWPERSKVANRFYGHVTKRIYAKSCTYPLISTFKEMTEFVGDESQTFYLDGPSGIDWVFVNSLIDEREQNLYVDYVKSFDPENKDYHWRIPFDLDSFVSEYRTPACVQLSYFLSELGAKSPSGLRAIGRIWRKFKPNSETDRTELIELIDCTLKDLRLLTAEKENSNAENFVKFHWSFPLWSLEIKEPQPQSKKPKELLKRRDRIIDTIQKTDSMRVPRPKITQRKVEELSNAYATWYREADSLARTNAPKKGLDFRSGEEMEIDCQLPSYRKVLRMFEKLTETEQAALLALGWYDKEPMGADWPRIYQRARDEVSTISTNYQVHLGRHWLGGYVRWKEDPQPFTPGRSRFC